MPMHNKRFEALAENGNGDEAWAIIAAQAAILASSCAHQYSASFIMATSYTTMLARLHHRTTFPRALKNRRPTRRL